MWRKMLKLRELAKSFYKKELGNGRLTSFWFDNWSKKGVLFDLLGDRGVIDMGVNRNATVEEAVLSLRRRRRHRVRVLNEIEAEITSIANSLNQEKNDINLWKRESGYKDSFSTQETWEMLRVKKPAYEWVKGTWFAHGTPKFSFIAWLSVRNRLSTMDRVAIWCLGVDSTCVLCKASQETRAHLFFECSYTSRLWEYIAKGIMGNSYTNIWSEVIHLLRDSTWEKKRLFCFHYAFQAVIYGIWGVRNRIRHGEKILPMQVLQRMIDKGIRNRISLMRLKKVKGMEELMVYWFSTSH